MSAATLTTPRSLSLNERARLVACLKSGSIDMANCLTSTDGMQLCNYDYTEHDPVPGARGRSRIIAQMQLDAPETLQIRSCDCADFRRSSKPFCTYTQQYQCVHMRLLQLMIVGGAEWTSVAMEAGA